MYFKSDGKIVQNCMISDLNPLNLSFQMNCVLKWKNVSTT